ncbi:MAG TPA: hypothetical protein PKY35_10965 [Candidatus Hydrogenedentes bacterium]|nr:hypothetical protein [Candidatus Hydrogenedentota bacterium]HOL77541.1 hypothetical protein [Candidatus Hydrogenedentota bacterium]HPO86580.1 hypothetical protein [Candidatus Hydrogenedentota bacterium]
MTSKKRWSDVYKSENPFQLPQALLHALRQKSKEFKTKSEVKYLWIYVSHDSLDDNGTPSKRLSTEEWLNVIDEAASLGVQYVVISVGTSLNEHPEVKEICQWAQSMYGMHVGVHLYCEKLTPDESVLLLDLDKSKTAVFLDCCDPAVEARFKEHGFDVYPALGQDQEHVSPECHLPEEMTCVGAAGTLYTCGLVLGETEYRLGHFFERPLDSVMHDPSLPHSIPEGLPKSKHRCNGCPPLMVQKMQERTK